MLDQKLFYPLYKDFEQKFFKQLQNAIDKKYSFLGNDKEKEFFVKCLLCLQMIKNYRAPLVAIKDNLKKKTDLKKINDTIRSKKFKIDYSWATWTHEKEMGKLAEKLIDSPLQMIGNQEEFDEFVLRYLLSIWLADWAGPLYALLKETENGKADLKKLNKILALWDFTGEFG